ncbi:MAG: 50S ribosomal protein L39e [Candidatus Micrarchaeia archaeon]
MGKKSLDKKRKLAKAGNKSRRIPVLAILRTHRRIQSNKLARSWRRQKLHIEE